MVATAPILTIQPEQAFKLLHDPKTIFFEVTAQIPNRAVSMTQTYQEEHIPSALEFDLEQLSDQASPLPHTMPSPKFFEQEMKAKGVNENSFIIVYDQTGIFTSARAWWMLRHFGHKNVAVLSGGLPLWKEKGYPTTANPAQKIEEEGSFYLRPPLTSAKQIYHLLDLESAYKNNLIKIIDARSPGRFAGTEPETWPNRATGHIPGSINIPISDVLTAEQDVKNSTVLQGVFERAGITRYDRLVFTCGSGVTACVLALAATKAGYTVAGIYDGSWAEYGLKRKDQAETASTKHG